MANIPFKSITFPGLPNKYTVPEISNDLMTAGKAADAKKTGDALSALEDQFSEETDKLKADLEDLEPNVEGFGLQLKYNAFDLLDYGNNKTDNTYGDLSFTWNEAKTECTVVGSNTANKSSNVLYDLLHLPELLIPGNRYTLTMDSTDSNIQMQIVMRTVSKPSPQTIIYINSTSELYIPDDVTEFGIRLYVKKNTEVNGVVSNIHLFNAQTNDILSKRISDIVGATKTIITVKSDGSGDYPTIKSAVESITGASAENPYEIDIYPGIYNTLDGYTAEYIAQAESNDFYGVMIPDHVDIKGVGDVHEVILTATLDSNDYVKALRNRISTLNVSGNVTIENITIKATNIRYCVHDAFSANVGRYKRTIKNVIMIASNLTSGNPPRTYGCGIMAPAEDFYFENVDFGGDLVIHSNTVVTETCNAEVVNCRGRVVHISPSGDYYNAHSFVFKRCNFEGYRLAGEDLTLPQNLFITAYGNEKAFIFASPNRIVLTGGIEKVVRTNLAVGTMCKINGSTLSATNSKIIYYGVVVYNDDDFTYVQRQGCINAVMIGLSNLSEGDYVTAGQDGALTSVGATAENAVGVVILNRTEPFIKML